MERTRSIRRAALSGAGLLVATFAMVCATLGSLGIRPLRIQSDPDRRAELRLGNGLLPTSATLRMWARVENPNPIGVTLSSIDGTVFLEDARVGAVDLPLGVPLESGA